MFIEVLFLAAALIGTAAGGWIDLKTTEIPDIVPISMVGTGLILHIANSILLGSFHGLVYALTIGAIYLALGYMLYYTGQWGEADVLLLAAVGFLIAQPLSFFNITAMKEIYPLVFLLNTFIVGGIYSIAYSAVLAVRKPEVFSNFFKDIIKNRRKVTTLIISLTSGVAVLTIITGYALKLNIVLEYIALQFILAIPIITALILLYRFAVVLDCTIFKSSVQVSKLKEGDVLAEDLKLKSTTLSGKLFIGLTGEQIKLIKKEKKHVSIKEGIRYGPTFFLSILFTWFFGNSILLIFGWI